MTGSHVPGHTTETLLRPAHDFTSPVDLIELAEEGERLMAEAGRSASHRAARTLSKSAPLNVVLLAVKGGAEIRDHSVSGAALFQVLTGKAHFEIDGEVVDVPAGKAITLAAGVPHRLSAPQDAVLLLVVAGA